MKKQMTHEEHVELAATLYPALNTIRETHLTLCRKLGKSHPATKKLARVLYSIVRAKSELDSAYHTVTSEEQFLERGHVYYGGRNDN